MPESPQKIFALQVVRKLRQAGFEALWAGGCVRDLLLGIPATDFDVATSARPEQVRELFGRRRTLPVGMAFGVVIVLGPTKSAGQVEVATFRTDATYSDGRHPDSVTFSSPADDARRRDFTINGMFLDPEAGRVIDYVGGQADLDQGVIRAIGNADERLAEDKLRMLRAVRFAARFDFEIERQTEQAIASHASEIVRVSEERICMEVRKTLESPKPSWAVLQWWHLGLLSHILPEIARGWPEHGAVALALLDAGSSPAMKSPSIAACHHLPAGESPVPRLDQANEAWQPVPAWRCRMAELLWATGETAGETNAEPQVSALKTRLKLANEDSAGLLFALQSQPILEQAPNQPWSQVQPLLVARHTPTALCLLASRAAVSHRLPEPRAENLQQVVSWLQRRLNWPAAELDPPPLLGGGDLIDFGLRPGPTFRDLLQELRRQQLDGSIVDRSAALDWLRGHLP